MSEVSAPEIMISTDHSAAGDTSRKTEIIEGLAPYVEEQLSLLLPVENIWQPTDYLPDLQADDWMEKLTEIREGAKGLPDDILVTLVGDMITEEALPTYQTMLNRFEGAKDETGDDENPWGKWSRGWTSEENRHGDLLNKFLYLTGRVDMRAIEVTIQNLIRRGFNSQTEADPYQGFIYTSFQERATKISHSNVGVLAKKAGNAVLSRISQVIAGDEARHEEAYKRFMDKIFDIDPNGAILAFQKMMKNTIQMPARLMDDGQGGTNLFDRFSIVAQRIGVYTAKDYADIIDHLVDRWKINLMDGLKGEAAKAQEFLSTLGERYRKLAERAEKRSKVQPSLPFSWVYNRAV